MQSCSPWSLDLKSLTSDSDMNSLVLDLGLDSKVLGPLVEGCQNSFIHNVMYFTTKGKTFKKSSVLTTLHRKMQFFSWFHLGDKLEGGGQDKILGEGGICLPRPPLAPPLPLFQLCLWKLYMQYVQSDPKATQPCWSVIYLENMLQSCYTTLFRKKLEQIPCWRCGKMIVEPC